MDCKQAALGLGLAFGVALSPLACGPAARDPPSVHGAATCIDEDGDGYGYGCPRGDDCDDEDPGVTVECPDAPGPADAGHSESGCEEGATLDCTFHLDAGPGPPLCFPAERTCRDGGWSACAPVED